MTGEEMCEYVAEVLERVHGVTVDPKVVWELSPSGEVGPVVDAYWQARRWDAESRGMRLVTETDALGFITAREVPA